MPDELTTLFEWIESINKALLLAVLTVVLFLAAPRSDEALLSGQKELEALLGAQEDINAAIAAQKGSAAESTVIKQLEGALEGKAEPLGDADLEALGLAPATTIGDLLDTLEGKTSRCEPKLDTEVSDGFRSLQGNATLAIKGLTFESSRSDDFALASTATLSAARDTARAAKAVPAAPPAPAKNPARPHPPATEDRIEKIGDKMVTVATAQAQQLRSLREAAGIQDQIDSQRKAFEAAKGVLDASRLALIDSVGALRRSLSVQGSEHSAQAPRFVVATLKHETPGVPSDIFAIPLACEPVPVLERKQQNDLSAKARPLGQQPSLPLLISLRAGDTWERVRGAEPDEARMIVQQAIAKEKGQLDVFGLSVHEDLLGSGLPWLLALGVAFQLVHVYRLRQLSRQPEYADHIRAAAKALPTLPAPSNWLSGVLVYGSVLGSTVMVLVAQFSGNRAQLVGCLAAGVISFTGLVLSILPPKPAAALIEAKKNEALPEQAPPTDPKP